MNYTTYYYYVNYSMYSTGILQSKLEAAGVRGSALDWLNNFLSNSIQKVRNADQFSAPIYLCKRGHTAKVCIASYGIEYSINWLIFSFY